MKFKKGDRAKRINEEHAGVVTAIRERGVAGCAVTYIEWIEVTYTNGMTTRGDPRLFVEVQK
jgi:hypothetical protein